MTATSRRVNPLARQSGGRHADPRRVKRPPLTSWLYVGRHRATAAEQVVARLDSYSQAEHVEGISKARERGEERRASRRARARAAAEHLNPSLNAVLGTYERTVERHLRDGRTPEDAMALAWIDADDALTAWAVSL